jgi:RNA polymerase sigma factor (sigma-70 family)
MTLPGYNTDTDLLAAVRRGDTAAYGTLYERHSAATRKLAHTLARNPADADDLVAETFANVLATLRAGHGPMVSFRAYLHTTLRHVLYHRAHRDRRIEFTDDLSRYDAGEPYQDPALATLERAYAAAAFRQLPPRWRAVLWHLEVEEATPSEIAPLLGLSPGAVAALAHRAREGLRRLYLQQHVTRADHPECRWAGDRLSGHVRGRLGPREHTRLRTHLGWCGECRSRLAEVRAVVGLPHARRLPAVRRPSPGGRHMLRLSNERAGSTTRPVPSTPWP